MVLLIVLTLPGCWRSVHKPPPRAVEDADIERLLEGMRERLALMVDVAKWKWTEKRPISDPKREAELLDRLVAKGKAHEIDGKFLRRFYEGQIEAAKQIQESKFVEWSKNDPGKFENVVDLGELRKRIDECDESLLPTLAVIAASLGEEKLAKQLQERAEDILVGEAVEAVRPQALAPLLGEK
jgi:chorismate mutase-like protein